MEDKTSTKANKISIIVPVYNGENCIERCLRSLVNQTYKNIEILCIDDGSTDNSLNKIKHLASKDARIIVVHQENKGVSVTRNRGLEMSSGQYIMFCDMDDWYEQDMCFNMLQIIERENVDLVVCNTNIIEYDEFNRDIRYLHSIFQKKQKVTIDIIKKMNVVLWNKIYKKNTIDKYKIKFPENCENDDDCFFMQYISVSNYIYFLPLNLYNYVIHKGSLCEHVLKRNAKHLYDRFNALQMFFNFLHLHQLINQKKEIFAWFLFLEFSCMIKNMNKKEVSKLKKMIVTNFLTNNTKFITKILKHRQDIYFFNFPILQRRLRTVQTNTSSNEWIITTKYFNFYEKEQSFFIK